jgi:hypothetical protein
MHPRHTESVLLTTQGNYDLLLEMNKIFQDCGEKIITFNSQRAMEIFSLKKLQHFIICNFILCVL